MFSKFLIMMLVAGFANGAFAADEAKTWQDKLILSYHGEFGFMRESKVTGAKDSLGDLGDFTSFHNPTLGWNFGKGIKLTSTWEFRYADHSRPKFVNRFYRALVSLTKSKLLTEEQYGVQLDVGIGRRYFDRTAVRSVYGNNRVNATLTKNWGSNNASLFVQYLHNDPKDIGTSAADDSNWRHGVELIPTLNLQLTDKLSFTSTDDINYNSSWIDGHPNESSWTHEFNFAVFTYKFNDIVSSYLQLKYNHLNDFDYSARSDNFEYYIGTAYALTPKITVTGEIGTELMTGSDNQLFSERAGKPEIMVYLDAAF